MEKILEKLKKELLNKEMTLKELNNVITNTFGGSLRLQEKEDYYINNNTCTYFLGYDYSLGDISITVKFTIVKDNLIKIIDVTEGIEKNNSINILEKMFKKCGEYVNGKEIIENIYRHICATGYEVGEYYDVELNKNTFIGIIIKEFYEEENDMYYTFINIKDVKSNNTIVNLNEILK